MVAMLAFCVSNVASDTGGYAAEAQRLTDKMISTFYDSPAKIWKPPVASSEAVGTQGYTFWPSMLAWQAIIEAAKVQPVVWKPRVGTYFNVLEQYYDKAGHAYCAWKYFPGNDDKFYDDNAWAVIACMEAFETTGDRRFHSRAKDVFDRFVIDGWDPSGRPGGVRWGTKAGLVDRQDRTVSATAASALGALLLAKHGDGQSYRTFAKQALDWIRDNLSSKDGLIYDGFKAPDYHRMNTIWTYNTGVPIRAALEFSRQTGDSNYRSWAIRMGTACLNRELSPMFDGAVSDRQKRYWYDSTFFIHYLVDGMRELSRATGDARYVAEARREADYCIEFLRDGDGLYWRNMRLWTIDAGREAAFEKLTEQNRPTLSPDASERSLEQNETSKPVNQRKMVKTLLANAGVARMLWLLAH